MHVRHWQGDTPHENLAIDETLLDACEIQGTPALRVWESPTYFVVMGRSGKREEEACVDVCERDGVPILARCSGGGTVLQGPGCLNYTVVLPFSFHPSLGSISGTTAFVMEKMRQVVAQFEPDVAIQGISDLALFRDGAWLKVSGNAQRRRYRAFLFHGTLLYNFNLDQVTRYLQIPKRQPAYRDQRAHHQFVMNLAVSKDQLIDAFSDVWQR